MMNRYTEYNWTRKEICRIWEISPQRFNAVEKLEDVNKVKSQRINPNKITDREKQSVIKYALLHTQYNHRELSYRMIDENIAYISPSSVYRILVDNNLIHRKGKRPRPERWNPHDRLSGPDEVWQTDLMIISYRGRHYYLISYIDVFSRFIVYNELLSSMTGDTVQRASEEALRKTGKRPKAIQSDNGSCYISQEFKSFISKFNIEARYIHPHCPNENAEIERYHGTLRELIDPTLAKNFDDLLKIIKEQVEYYNYKRYHSAIGFITPYDKYNGRAEKIFSIREKKLKSAKEKRIQENLNLHRSKNIKQEAA